MSCTAATTLACVNLKHLFIGSHADNMRDCANKGRFSGRKNRTILTAEDVRRIRDLFSNGISQPAIARYFGVSFWCINAIKRGRNWKSIT